MSDLDTILERMRTYESRAIDDARRAVEDPIVSGTLTDLDGAVLDHDRDRPLPLMTRVLVRQAPIHCTLRDGHGTITASAQDFSLDVPIVYRLCMDRPYVIHRADGSDELARYLTIDDGAFDVLHRPA